MPDPSEIELPQLPPPPSQIHQEAAGDRNQAISQAINSTVVYVTEGAQVTIYQSQVEQELQAKPQSLTSTLAFNPYKGLFAFQETDGDWFFGREKQIEQLWQEFRSLYDQEAGIRLLPIYGPSGSGKSSLARAGLIPKLVQQSLLGRERLLVLVPGNYPLESLASVLAGAATTDPMPVTKTRELLEELRHANSSGEFDGLRRIVNLLPEIATSPLIVLIDQFEEVYTLYEDLAERDAFIGNLLCAAIDRSKRVSVIITLRSDFLSETQKHPLLNRLFSKQGFLVPAMDEEEMRQAIHKPAELAGRALDEATVTLLLEQTSGRAGALPSLQFALSRVWEGLKAGDAPSVTLDRIGGVGGALAGEAQRVYDSLEPVERTIARRVFLGLVQLGEGMQDTRRRVMVQSLVSYKTDLSQVKRVIDRFAEPSVRLVTCSASSKGTETVEVTHEALFTHWQLLNQWLEQSRNDLRFQRRLEEDAQYWDQSGCPAGNLWRPPDLDLLKQYSQRSGDDMTPLQMKFFEASKRYENNRKQVRYVSIGALVAGLVLTTALSFLYWNQWVSTKREVIKALSTASKAEFVANRNALNALLEALKAGTQINQADWSKADTDLQTEVMTTLGQAVYWVKEQNRLEGQHTSSVRCVSFSSDGQVVATASDDNTVILWNRDGSPLHVLKGHTDVVIGVSFSPDGQTLASASADKTIKLWSRQGQLIRTLVGHSGQVNSVSFSPDGQVIATASNDMTIKLWNRQGKLIRTLKGHTDWVNNVSFSPDGKTIASAGGDRTVRLWNQAGQQTQLLKGHTDWVRSVSFSPDGKTIASASDDTTVKLWTIDGRLIRTLEEPEGWVNSVSFSPDGQTIAAGSNDNLVRLWNRQGQLLHTLEGHQGFVNSVSFSPNGLLATAGSDKTVKLWQVNNPWLIQLAGHEDQVNSVSFSPDGQTIATASNDNTAKLWSRQGQLLHTLKGHQGFVNSVTFSPDGRILATASFDNTVRLWRQDGRLIRTIAGKDWVYGLSFSPDGQLLATASADGTAKLWRLDGSLFRTLTGHKGKVYGLHFSRDGQILATAGEDNTVKLWSQTGALLTTLVGHTAAVWGVSFSPDGTIATASDDRTVKLWRPDGRLITTLVGHRAEVNAARFSLDGKTLATASSDRTVILWNVENLTLKGLLEQGCSWIHDYQNTNPKAPHDLCH